MARATAQLFLYVWVLSLLAHGATSLGGYCGDGVCSGAETGAWCTVDCFCGDGLCSKREEVYKICPSECSSRVSVTGQPAASSVAGTPLNAVTQIWKKDGLGTFASTRGLVHAELLTASGDAPPGSVSLGGTTSTYSECGAARFTDLAVSLTGSYMLRFTASVGASTLSSMSQPFDVVAGQIHHLTMSIQPRGFRPGIAFKQQPVTEVRDAADNLIETGDESTTEVTASLWSGNPDAVLDVDPLFLKRTCFQGVAKFTNFKVRDRATDVAILFSAGPLILPVRSSFFVVADVPSVLSILAQPTGGRVGVPFAVQPSLAATDAYGNLASWYEGDGIVIATVLNAPPTVAASLYGGEKVMRMVDGLVDFSGLSVDRSGTGFSITFTATVGFVPGFPLTNTTQSFDIDFGLPYKLFIETGTNPEGAVPGSILVQQPTILVQDVLGNTVSDDTGIVEVTASLVEAGALTNTSVKPLLGLAVVKSCAIDIASGECASCSSGSCGTASWPSSVSGGLRVDKVGQNYQIRFTSPGLVHIDSFPPFDVSYGEISALRMKRQPFGFRLGVPFKGQPVVELLDKADNLVPASDSQVIAELVVDDVCCFPPSMSVVTLNGAANFEGYAVTDIPSTYGDRVLRPLFKLRFTSPSIAQAFSIDSDEFVLAMDPTRLTVLQEPSLASSGVPLAVQPVISVEDSNGTKAGWYLERPVRVTATVCVAIDSIFGSYDELGGRKGDPVFRCHDATDDFCSVQEQTPLLLRPVMIPTPRMEVRGQMHSDAVDGIVSFTDLRLDKWGTYRLRFDAPGFAPTFSSPFSVITGPSVRLHVLVQPTGARPGAAMGVQPTVVMHDLGGNVATSANRITLSASLRLPDGAVSSVKIKTANDNTMLPVAPMQFGVCVFEGLRVDTVGVYVIRFAGGGVAAIDSASFTVSPSASIRLRIATGPGGCRFGFPCLTQPVIEVVDDGGNVAVQDSSAKITVRWLPVSSGLCRAEDAVAGGGLLTASMGRATSTSVGLTREAGEGGCDGRYSLEATSPGLEGATFLGVIASGDPTGLSVTVSPAAAFPGLQWQIQAEGMLVDSLGRRVSSATAVVQANLLDCGGGLGCVPSNSSLFGNRAVTTALGAVRFTDLRLDTQKTCYRVELSSPPLASSLTLAFDVQPSTFITHVAVVTQPSDTIAGAPIPIQPVVAAMDKGANIMAKYSQKVSAIVYNGDSNDWTMSGTRTIIFSNGIATFTNLQIDRASCCLALEFGVASGLVTGYSQNFCAYPSNPTRLALSRSPAGVKPGIPLATQPILAMVDDYGNPVTTRTCQVGCNLLSSGVSASLDGDEPAALLGNVTVGFVGGVAEFTSLRIDRAGTHSLSFHAIPPSTLASLPPTDLVSEPAIDRATKLIIATQPYGFAGDVAGRHISVQPRVAIADIGDNIIERASTMVTASLQGSVTGSWLRGTTEIATVEGIANFTDLRLGPSPDGPGLKLSLLFTSGPACTSGADFCSPVVSRKFDMAGAVTFLRIEVQPGNATAGMPLDVQPAVSIYDASGRLYSYFGAQGRDVLYASLVNGTITVNGTNATMLGNRSAVYDNSIARWTDLSFETSGDWVLSFGLLATTGESFSVQSVTIKVLPSSATNLTLVQQPGEPSPGLPFGAGPNVTVVDIFGNIVSTWNASVTAKLLQDGNPSDVLPMGDAVAAPIEGTATFPTLGLNTAGTGWSFSFSSEGVTSVTSQSINMSAGLRVDRLELTSDVPLESPNGPGGIFDGLPFLFKPVVLLLDLGGNLVVEGDNTTNVTISFLGGGYPDFNFSSPDGLSLAPVGGKVVFENLTIEGQGSSGAQGPLRFAFTHNLTWLGVNDTVMYEELTVTSDQIAVSRNASRLDLSSPPSATSTGGSVFEQQPRIHLVDSAGVAVVNSWAGPAMVTATLAATGPATCPSTAPHRCSALGTACAVSSSHCPTMTGTLVAPVVRGAAAFTDLAITTCNDASSPSCLSASIVIVFTAQPLSSDSPSVLPLSSASITITAGPAVELVYDIQPLYPAAGLVLGQQPRLRVVDGGGNTVPTFPTSDVTVSLIDSQKRVCCPSPCICQASLIGPSPGTSSVSSAANAGIIQTAGVGIMTAGVYMLRATTSVGGFTADSALVTVVVGSGYALEIKVQPGPSTTGGTAFNGGYNTGSQPRVAVVDRGGNTVSSFSGSVDAQLQAEGIAPALSGTVSANVDDGVAIFSDLTINRIGSCYTLLFTTVVPSPGSSIIPIISQPFSVVIGPSSRIVITRQPSGFRPGYPFEVQPEVEVQDMGFNKVPSAIDEISVRLGNVDPAINSNVELCSFTPLNCYTTAFASAGVASFSGLRVDVAGDNYFITFERRAGGFQPAVSQSFSVEKGPGMQLGVSREPGVTLSSRGQPGLILETQPQVQLQDAGGNTVDLPGSSVTASLWSGGFASESIPIPIFEKPLVLYPPTSTSAALIRQDLVRPQSLSRYIFTDLQIDRVGSSYTIRFTAGPGILSAESQALAISVGRADRVAVLRIPSGTMAATPFLIQPVAAIHDRGGNTLKHENPSQPMIVTLVLPTAAESPEYAQAATSKLQPISSQMSQIVDGVAVFSGLMVDSPGSGFRLKVSTRDLTPALTPTFVVSDPATAVDVDVHPRGSFADTPLSLQPVARLEDSGGRLTDVDSSTVVTAAINGPSNRLGASVSGTPVRCCWGICRFTDLSISKAELAYRLDMSAPGLRTVTSAPFLIEGPALLRVASPPNNGTSGFPFESQPVVEVTDYKGLLMGMCVKDGCFIGGAAVVTASITGINARMSNLTGSVTAEIVNGVARFTDLGIEGGGGGLVEPPYVLRFDAPDLNHTLALPLVLTYVPRPPRDYIEGTVRMSPMTIEEFTPPLQAIFISTIASNANIDASLVEIFTVVDSTGQPAVNASSSSSPPSAATATATTPPPSNRREAIIFGEEGRDSHTSLLPSSTLRPLSPSVPRKGGARKLLATRSIDLTFRLFPQGDDMAIYNTHETISAFLKRDGLFATALAENGFPPVTSQLTKVPTSYKADGSFYPPLPPPGIDYVVVAGATVGTVVFLFGSGVLWWRRSRRRKMMRLDKDDEGVMWAIGIEQPADHNYVDDALPWTAAQMLREEKIKS